MKSDTSDLAIMAMEHACREIEWLARLLHGKLVSTDGTLELLKDTIKIVKERK